MDKKTFCIILLALFQYSCRKSDYKRIVFSEDVKKNMESSFLKELNDSSEEVVNLYAKMLEEHKNQHLIRLQPERNVGSFRIIEIEGNRKTSLKLTTLSKRRPLIFQIDDFLFDDECDYIKAVANAKGFEKSKTLGEIEEELATEPTFYDLLGDIPFNNWDNNNDSFIDLIELQFAFKKYFDIRLGSMLTNEIMKKTYMDFNLNGRIEPWEWKLKNLTSLVLMLQESKRINPASATRFSESQWLPITNTNDSILLSIQDRLHKVSGLSLEMIKNSEPLQVVKYQPGGHYDCHLDSDPQYHADSINTCCHTLLESSRENSTCSPCRFMTVLYFLEDTKRGGQTAFPVAGLDPYLNNLTPELDTSKENWCDLSIYCSTAKIVVTPKKGRAVLWYNHFIDPDTEWTGAVDRNSLHGGCAVNEGSKWIANNWINAGQIKKHDILSWAKKTIFPEEFYAETENVESAKNNERETKL